MNEAQLASLVAAHRELLTFARRHVGSRDAAEDVLQDALVRSLPRAAELRDEDSAVSWLYRTLRNAIVDRHRRGGASERALTALAAEPSREEQPQPDDRDAVCRCVTALTTTLKPEYGEVLRRVDVDGVSVHDFAVEAGITPNNASVRLHRARQALRERVRASCGACADHGCIDCGCRHPSAGPEVT